MNHYDNHQSSIANVDANVMALLCYIISTVAGFLPVVGYVAWVLPLVIFFVEKQSGLVRFHSMQAFVLNLIGSVINICVVIVFGILTAVFSIIKIGFIVSIVSGLVSVAVGIAILVFAVLAMIGAYQYNEYEIPVISSIARWAIAQAESKMNK